MTLHVYVASRLENAPAVRELHEALRREGVVITYDWTAHGSVQLDGPARIAEVAAAELAGIDAADLLVALLPGGAGTHVEIGYALGRRIPVFLFGPRATAPRADGTGGHECAFYRAEGCYWWDGTQGLFRTIGLITSFNHMRVT